jgi:predicted double-glycine peptidase
MNYFCLQTHSKGCGFACVKMLLANTFKNPDYLNITEDLNHGNYSMNELIKISDNYGVHLEGFEIVELNKNTIKVPCIGIIIQNNKRHFIYIYNFDNEIITYFDPLNGEVTMSLTSYSAISDNKYLLINKIKDKKVKYENKNKIKIKYYNLSQYIISLIQCFSIFLCSFSDKNWSITLFISLFIFIMSIFSQHYLRVHFAKKFDKKYIYSLMNNENVDVDAVKNAFALKRDYFGNANTTLLHSLTLGFSLFILAVNDIKSLIALLIICISKYLLKKIFDKKNDILKSEINSLESSDLSTNYSLANTKSYKYLENIQIQTVTIDLLMLFSAFLICFINKNFNQFIIVFVLMKISIDKVDEIIKVDDLKIYHQRNECKYFSYIESNKK